MQLTEGPQAIEKPINSTFQLLTRARTGATGRACGETAGGIQMKSIEELSLYIFQRVTLPPSPPRLLTLQARRQEARP